MKLKLILKKIIMLMFLAFAYEGIHAQSDAFFYEVYSETERDEGLSFDMLGDGLSFNDMDWGLDGDDGLSFGDMEIVPDNVSTGCGLALLAGMAFFYVRRKKDNED